MNLTRSLRNLSLRSKFHLITGLMLATLATPSVIVIRDAWLELQVARTEEAGIRPSSIILEAIHLSQQHRGLSVLALAGDSQAEAERRKIAKRLDEALTGLAASVAGVPDSALSASAMRIAESWRSLSGAIDGRSMNATQSFERHNAFVAEEITLLEDVANSSGIVLHPKAGGYHLQMAALAHLPRLAEALGQLATQGGIALEKGVIGGVERARLSQLREQVAMRNAAARKELMLAGEADTSLAERLGTALTAADRAAGEMIALVDGKVLGANELEYPPAEFRSAFMRSVGIQFELVVRSVEALGNDLTASADASMRRLIGLTGMMTVLASLAALALRSIASSILSSMTDALRVAQAVAEGDLAQRVRGDGRDEPARMLDALQNMAVRLSTIVEGVRKSADGVATASTQIAEGNADLSSRTEQQASALQQTAASMEQLSATVQRNAAAARNADELARNASQTATRGGQSVEKVISTMNEISSDARRIAEIIGVVDGIAFQTNILALNASVEAARAGEQGRGFAVVAGEVRALAQRSADAARQVKSLIESSTQRVQLGSQLVNDAGTTIREVVESIRCATSLITEISSASLEQHRGVVQIGEAITQLDRSTQQNAALVEQSGAAAEALRSQAQWLVEAVSIFRLPSEDATV